MIDTDAMVERVRHLKEGRRLICKHAGYGDYIFYMNPQRNRIFADPDPDGCPGLTPINPESFLMWGFGEWLVEISPPVKAIREVVVSPGEYRCL